jgi:hypothetical protein
MRRRASLLVVLAAAALAPGCMFHVEHRIPVDATFGQARAAGAVRTPFESQRVKRYLLGGTLPWSLSYRGSQKLVEWAPGRRVEGLEIRTRFSPFDALLRFVPYLTYVLAQRTVEIRGVYVDSPEGAATADAADAAVDLPPVSEPPRDEIAEVLAAAAASGE